MEEWPRYWKAKRAPVKLCFVRAKAAHALCHSQGAKPLADGQTLSRSARETTVWTMLAPHMEHWQGWL
eukprot:5081716-Amphidinium_carterae.1